MKRALRRPFFVSAAVARKRAPREAPFSFPSPAASAGEDHVVAVDDLRLVDIAEDGLDLGGRLERDQARLAGLT